MAGLINGWVLDPEFVTVAVLVEAGEDISSGRRVAFGRDYIAKEDDSGEYVCMGGVLAGDRFNAVTMEYYNNAL